MVVLSDLHQEVLRSGRETLVCRKGCYPADAVQQRDDGILMTFVCMPKGTFYLSPFWWPPSGYLKQNMGEYEIAVHDVTQGQWQAVMGNNPSHFSRTGGGQNAVKDISDYELKLFPVENVSWNDAQAFINKLNEKERDRGYAYRLPSVAESEYACKAGATTQEECSYHFYLDKPTNDLSSEQANFNGNFPGGTHRRESFWAHDPCRRLPIEQVGVVRHARQRIAVV